MKLLITAILFTAVAFSQATPRLYSNDGKGLYLGKLSANPYDADSTSNPYGIYGSPFSDKSINNPFGVYGSQYSPYSATNPYTTQAPVIVVPKSSFGFPTTPAFPSFSTGFSTLPALAPKCCTDWGW